jgi:fatty-acid desaturase
MKNDKDHILKLVKFGFLTFIVGVILSVTYNTIIGLFVLIIFMVLVLISGVMIYTFSHNLWGEYNGR